MKIEYVSERLMGVKCESVAKETECSPLLTLISSSFFSGTELLDTIHLSTTSYVDMLT